MWATPKKEGQGPTSPSTHPPVGQSPPGRSPQYWGVLVRISPPQQPLLAHDDLDDGESANVAILPASTTVSSMCFPVSGCALDVPPHPGEVVQTTTKRYSTDQEVVFVVFGSFSLDLGLSETRGPMRETKKKCGSWHGKSLRLETKFKKYKNTNYGSNVSMDRQSLQSCLFANKKRNKYEGFNI